MRWLISMVFPLVLLLLSPAAWGQSIPGMLNVRDFGAKGDGQTDDTAAFQKAMDASAKAGGGKVMAPRGTYFFAGHLNVPAAVTLAGIWESVPAHNGLRDRGLPKPTDDGTTFLVTEGAGSETGPAFITLNTNSTLKGVVLYYPKQKPDDVPSPYPYAIAMRGKNPAVLDVELLNPYSGIDASRNERHLIRNVQGQPLRRGVFVDAIYDIGRIENVHFNPWWSNPPKLMAWQMANGEAFILARSDWQYMLNTFCFGYNVGYKFIQSGAGSCNGNFLGLGADDCWRAVVVEQMRPLRTADHQRRVRFLPRAGPDDGRGRQGARGERAVRELRFLGAVPADRQDRRAGDGGIQRLHVCAMGLQGRGPPRRAGGERHGAGAGLRVPRQPAPDPTGRGR